MMRMVEAAARDGIAGGQAGDGHRHSVENRNHQRQQRHREPRRQRTLADAAALNRQDAQHQADGERAFVAHEDRRGRKVEDHESGERPGDRERRDHRAVVLMESGDGRDTQRGDDADAGGKTVDAVDQVEGVGGGDQPQDRDRDVERVVGQKVEMRAPPYEDADRG